jgi:hypothetical protein
LNSEDRGQYKTGFGFRPSPTQPPQLGQTLLGATDKQESRVALYSPRDFRLS